MSMTNGRDYSALILAAGASSRMGVPKPLLRIGVETILKRTVRQCRAAGVTDIWVVLGFNAERFMPALDELDVFRVINHQHHEGMFSSIQTGVRALGKGCQAFFLLPGDMPFVRPETLRTLMAAFHGVRDKKKAGPKDDERISPPAVGRIYRPLYNGRRGHPPLISAELSQTILAFDSPGGLRALMSCYEGQCVDVPCNDPGILIDLDTPEDCDRYGVSICESAGFH